jgi:hypothetical protein
MPSDSQATETDTLPGQVALTGAGAYHAGEISGKLGGWRFVRGKRHPADPGWTRPQSGETGARAFGEPLGCWGYTIESFSR